VTREEFFATVKTVVREKLREKFPEAEDQASGAWVRVPANFCPPAGIKQHRRGT
jgi:hypothetical protein